MPLLGSDDASLRTGAVDALRAMPEVVSEHLPKLLSDPDSDVRIQSCEIARGLPSDEASRILCVLLTQETEPNVCTAAIDVLTEVGTADAVPALKKCAERFTGMPFMAFAIQVATDRILSQSDQTPIAAPSIPPHNTHGDLPSLTEDEFRRLCEFIYRRTGMAFTELNVTT